MKALIVTFANESYVGYRVTEVPDDWLEADGVERLPFVVAGNQQVWAACDEEEFESMLRTLDERIVGDFDCLSEPEVSPANLRNSERYSGGVPIVGTRARKSAVAGFMYRPTRVVASAISVPGYYQPVNSGLTIKTEYLYVHDGQPYPLECFADRLPVGRMSPGLAAHVRDCLDNLGMLWVDIDASRVRPEDDKDASGNVVSILRTENFTRAAYLRNEEW